MRRNANGPRNRNYIAKTEKVLAGREQE